MIPRVASTVDGEGQGQADRTQQARIQLFHSEAEYTMSQLVSGDSEGIQ